jgi:hypothetical protein
MGSCFLVALLETTGAWGLANVQLSKLAAVSGMTTPPSSSSSSLISTLCLVLYPSLLVLPKLLRLERQWQAGRGR